MSSRSINNVVLLGNLTRDPELKYTPSGTAVCTFGLATNRSWTTSDGKTREEAQYHRLVAWQKLAELCGKLLVKGKKVYVEGRITYRDYTTKDGQKKTAAEIVMNDFIVFNEGKKNSTDTYTEPNEVEDYGIPSEEGIEGNSDDEFNTKDITF
ncbi:MAG: single-stranded DNA-binding protein [Patescibacteria group bacterium]